MFAGSNSLVDPEIFISNLRGKIKILDGKQQDSHELFIMLIDLLIGELTKCNNQVYEDIQELRNLKLNNFVADTFYGMMETIVTCDYCSNRFKRKHNFSNITLNIMSTLSESIECWSKESTLEGNNMWHCPKCCVLRSSTHKINIIEYPKILVIHLMRFEGKHRKNNKLINIAEEITLSNNVYEAIGIVSHSGVLGCGHYIAYAKRYSSWYCFNDESVTKVSKDDCLRNSSAYLIFYERKYTKKL